MKEVSLKNNRKIIRTINWEFARSDLMEKVKECIFTYDCWFKILTKGGETQ